VSAFAKIAAGLQLLFPSSDRSVPRPSELSEVVQLVHPFPSQASDLQRARIVAFTSTNSVAPTLVVAPAAGDDVSLGPPSADQPQYDEWLFGEITHNAAAGVAARIDVALRDPIGSLARVGLYQWDSGTAGNPQNIPLMPAAVQYAGAFNAPMLRPLLVPAGWTWFAIGNTQAVAYQFTLRIGIVRRSYADVPLFR
jgi:hypothetical protein